jgi:hypothetical protein
MQQLVRVVWPADSQLKHTTRTNCCINTLLPHDDGQLASSKHVETCDRIN